jgi:hypothetical protein
VVRAGRGVPTKAGCATGSQLVMNARYYNGGLDDDPQPRRLRCEPDPAPEPEWCVNCGETCGAYFGKDVVTDGTDVWCSMTCYEHTLAKRKAS